MVAAVGARAAGQRFTAYGADELRTVLRYKYLGRILSHDDKRVSNILTRQEVPVSVAGMFNQAVVVTVLLYGSDF